MYYMFSEDKDQNIVITEKENLSELKRSVREYYKGKAIDNGDAEYEADGYITTLDHHGNRVTQEKYYDTGKMPIVEKDRSMFFVGGFV